MMPDGSRPVPRIHAISIEPARRQKYKVPGPRSLNPRRVWRPIVRCSQDEAHSWELVKDGPDIAVSQLSSESSPFHSNEEEDAIEEEKKQTYTDLANFVAQGGLSKLAPEFEEETKREKFSDINQIETMENLNSKQKTISMPDPVNKLSTFEPRNSRTAIASVYQKR